MLVRVQGHKGEVHDFKAGVHDHDGKNGRLSKAMNTRPVQAQVRQVLIQMHYDREQAP